MSLREVIERIRNLDEPPTNEEATKFQIVLPILQELGWDFTDPAQVQPEYTIPSTDGDDRKGRVDIALMKSPKGNRIPLPVALIEVKAPRAELESAIRQMLRYAFDSSAAVSALTDGLTWWLFLPHETQFHAQERRFAVVDLRKDRLQKIIDEFTTYLALSELTTRRPERHAKKVLSNHHDPMKARRDLEKEWRKFLDGKDKTLFDVIASVIFKSIGQRPSDDQISALLRNETLPATQTARDDTSASRSTPPTSNSSANKDDSKVGRGKPERPSAFVLFDKRHSVKRWAEVLVGVAEQLHSQRAADFDRALDLGSEKNRLVARRKVDIKRGAKPIPGSESKYWIGTNYSSKVIIDKCHDLLKAFGHSPDDLQIE